MQDGRLVADGPAAANIPGVVAGLDYLYRKYGSGKVKWAELVEPAITLADEGFILDESLPTSIAEGRHFLEKWPEAAKIYLPGGKVPRPGDRFVNKDYATTLRAIAKDGADTFYRGEIARKIAADLEDNGGIITLRRSRAVPGDRARAGGRPLPRPHALCRRSAGLDRHSAVRVAARARATTSRGPARAPTTDADYFHYLLESWKVRDQLRRVADPERWPVDFAEHLTAEHAKKLFAKIDPQQGVALRAAAAGRPAAPAAPHAAHLAPGRRRLRWPMPRAT